LPFVNQNVIIFIRFCNCERLQEQIKKNNFRGIWIMKTVKSLLIVISFCLLITLLVSFSFSEQKGQQRSIGPSPQPEPIVATFSIVAFDPNTREIGVAVQSRVVSVGAIVPWAKGGVGAIATQAAANTSYGPEGLKLLEQGLDPNEVIKRLTAADPGAASRQIGIVDANGRVATFTGPKCQNWAGGKAGKYYCAQGNILTGPEVVSEMAKAFENSKGDLGDRLITALEAGQAAGGDSRGKESAALYIVRQGWGYGGNDRFRDVRVDDNPEPIKELRRVYDVYKKSYPPRTGRSRSGARTNR
jgi:uncharacterized Ntn-hydrolase superfamily protein